jgi:hypothetical protein
MAGGVTCSGKALVSQCAAEMLIGVTFREKSCDINEWLASERFRSVPKDFDPPSVVGWSLQQTDCTGRRPAEA